jgi:hypothetical protein
MDRVLEKNMKELPVANIYERQVPLPPRPIEWVEAKWPSDQGLRPLEGKQ